MQHTTPSEIDAADPPAALVAQGLPPAMLQALPLLPPSKVGLMLFTRHSLRPRMFHDGYNGYGIQLSDEGRTLALAWGSYLSQVTQRRLVHCISSPIQRCLDTAMLMMQGAAGQGLAEIETIELLQQPLLVEPGSFVLDMAQVAETFRQKGAVEFIHQFVQNQLPGTKHPVQGVRDIICLLFTAYGHQAMQQPASLTLAVSHDTILAACVAVISGHFRVQRDDWPQMMEGLFVWFDDGGGQPCSTFEHSVMHWIWRGQRYRLVMADLQTDQDPRTGEL